VPRCWGPHYALARTLAEAHRDQLIPGEIWREREPAKDVAVSHPVRAAGADVSVDVERSGLVLVLGSLFVVVQIVVQLGETRAPVIVGLDEQLQSLVARPPLIVSESRSLIAPAQLKPLYRRL
jgi:hypothetical protein